MRVRGVSGQTVGNVISQYQFKKFPSCFASNEKTLHTCLFKQMTSFPNMMPSLNPASDHIGNYEITFALQSRALKGGF